MLKTALAASAAIAAIVALSAPSFADSGNDTATVNITGKVGAACNISGANVPIDFGTIGLDQNGVVNSGQTKPVQLTSTVWCNGGSNQVVITASPLTTSGQADGFANSVNYTLTTPLTSGSADVTTTDQSLFNSTYGVFSYSSGETVGNITLDNTNAKPLLAGTYNGSISITVTPG